MPHHGRRNAALAGLVTLGVSLAVAGPAFGSADHKTVKIHDDCERVSFTTHDPPIPCTGDGRTTFDAFIAEFVARQGSVEAWNFSRDEFGLDARGVITADNEGGEAHTFTEVGMFGAGCVDVLNGFAGPPATDPATGKAIDCATKFVPELVAPDTAKTVTVSTPGTHKFQCLIHPWMRSVVTVDGDEHGGGQD